MAKTHPLADRCQTGLKTKTRSTVYKKSTLNKGSDRLKVNRWRKIHHANLNQKKVKVYSAMKRNEIVPCAETWMDLATLQQSEASH